MRILVAGAAGYIGRFLTRELSLTYPDLVQMDRKAAPAGTVMSRYYGCDYRDASYSAFDVVLWFAGAASVIEAEDNPAEALDQNALGLLKVRRAMNPGAYLIYASSASVYSGSPTTPAKESDPIHPATNPYDRSKFLADYLNEGGWLPNSLGLRLGTVCGWSDPIRADTVFNKMNLDALELGKVVVSGWSAWRSLLFLNDLSRTIRRCIEERPTGLLNTASLACTIGYIADIVGAFHRVPVEDLGGFPNYVHHMDTVKQERLITPSGNPLAARCATFLANWTEAKGHYTVSWPTNLKPPRICPVPAPAPVPREPTP